LAVLPSVVVRTIFKVSADDRVMEEAKGDVLESL